MTTETRPTALLSGARPSSITLPRWFASLVKTEDDAPLLVARLGLGLVMFPHGAQKLFGWFGGYGFAGTMEFFTQGLGLPTILAFLVIVAESFGAVALVTGLLGRLAAFGIGAVMVGAILLDHLQHGFFMNWSGAQVGEGFEFHLLAIALAVAVILGGSGAFSLDRLITRGESR